MAMMTTDFPLKFTLLALFQRQFSEPVRQRSRFAGTAQELPGESSIPILTIETLWNIDLTCTEFRNLCT
jgi:hypothetical protein